MDNMDDQRSDQHCVCGGGLTVPPLHTATRAKMSMMNSMSRMRGQEKGPGYTQAETILGDSMQKFGRELGEESNFGKNQSGSRLVLLGTISGLGGPG